MFFCCRQYEPMLWWHAYKHTDASKDENFTFIYMKYGNPIVQTSMRHPACYTQDAYHSISHHVYRHIPEDGPCRLSYTLHRQAKTGAQGQGSCVDRPTDWTLTNSRDSRKLELFRLFQAYGTAAKPDGSFEESAPFPPKMKSAEKVHFWNFAIPNGNCRNWTKPAWYGIPMPWSSNKILVLKTYAVTPRFLFTDPFAA